MGSSAQANVIDQTGPTSFGSPTALSPSTNSPYAEPVNLSSNGAGVAFQFSDGIDGSNAGTKGNRDVAGTWQAPGSMTSFSNGDYTDSVSISEGAGRVAWRQSSSVLTASWAADGTPGTAATITAGGFSPVVVGNGTAVAYIRADGNGDNQVFLATGSGSSWTDEQVTTDGADFIYGTSSDGKQIIYESTAEYVFHGARKVGNSWVIQTFGDAEAEDSDPYYDVAGDGSFAWKDDDTNKGMVIQFRNGAWLDPVELADNVGNVEISDNGQVFAFSSGNRIRARAWTPAGWEPERRSVQRVDLLPF